MGERAAHQGSRAIFGPLKELRKIRWAFGGEARAYIPCNN